MTLYTWSLLLLLVVATFFWTSKTSIEAFEDVKMTPWFGYEPGRYGPGWGRKGCNTVSPDCITV
jgi:hypothetical protein